MAEKKKGVKKVPLKKYYLNFDKAFRAIADLELKAIEARVTHDFLDEGIKQRFSAHINGEKRISREEMYIYQSALTELKRLKTEVLQSENRLKFSREKFMQEYAKFNNEIMGVKTLLNKEADNKMRIAADGVFKS